MATWLPGWDKSSCTQELPLHRYLSPSSGLHPRVCPSSSSSSLLLPLCHCPYSSIASLSHPPCIPTLTLSCISSPLFSFQPTPFLHLSHPHSWCPFIPESLPKCGVEGGQQNEKINKKSRQRENNWHHSASPDDIGFYLWKEALKILWLLTPPSPSLPPSPS